MENPSRNARSAIARVTPSLPQRGRQPTRAGPLDPQLGSFFLSCLFTAMLHRARGDRSRAPMAPSLSNTVSYRLPTDPLFLLYWCRELVSYHFFPKSPVSHSAAPALKNRGHNLFWARKRSRSQNEDHKTIRIALRCSLHHNFSWQCTIQSSFWTVVITVLSALTRAYHLSSDSMTVHGAMSVLVRASISSTALS